MNMKLSDYLLFAAVLTPTLVVAAAAIVSVVAPEPDPQYRPPVLGVHVLREPVVR